MVQALEMMYAYPLGLSNQSVQVCSSGCLRLKSGEDLSAIVKNFSSTEISGSSTMGVRVSEPGRVGKAPDIAAAEILRGKANFTDDDK